MGKYQKALKTYERCKNKLISSFSNKDEEVHKIENNIAGVHLKIGNNEVSLVMYEKVLKFKEKKYGRESK